MEENKNEELLRLVSEKKFRHLKTELCDMNEVDVAEFIEEVQTDKKIIVFRMLPKELASDVFACLDVDTQKIIIDGITDKELAYIIEELYVDDAVDMLEEMPATVVKRVLQNASPSTRLQINEFLNYPENSAGSIMTAEFIGLRKTMTVEEAFAYIRKHGIDKETIYTCYVMDSKRHLEGVVTVKDLLMNPYDAKIEDIMDTNVIKAVTTEDKEEIADMFNRYDCEPAFPPVSVKIGTNDTKSGKTANASSYLVSIPPVSIELIISTNSHVILFFASSNTLSGVELDDFNTVQHPLASTGASFHAAIRKGKFQGTICPTTPIGSLRTILRVSVPSTFALPSSAKIQPAKYLKCSAANGTSTANVSLIGLPLSIDSTNARNSLFSSITSAILFKITALCAGVVFFQLSNAFQADSTAASTSSFVACAHSESRLASAGLYTLKVSLSEASTHLPPIKS